VALGEADVRVALELQREQRVLAGRRAREPERPDRRREARARASTDNKVSKPISKPAR